MSILIEGMEMPKTESEVLIIAIKSDGSVYPVRIDGDGQPMVFPNEEMKNCAVPVPPHGRLIDESEFFARLDDGIKTISSLALPEDFVAVYTQLVKEVKEEIGKCRTIIPAEEG